nr:rna polymerase ii transcription factor b subunit 4 [Quercus suber]
MRPLRLQAEGGAEARASITANTRTNMNAVDGTDRSAKQDEAEPPSLLTIVLDTNPHAWALLGSTLSLSKGTANLLVFINAHLAINPANRVAVVASHSDRAEWLYPTPVSVPDSRNDAGVNGSEQQDTADAGGPVRPPDDANKYRPFAQTEHALLNSLRRLMSETTGESISAVPSTMLAGALTLALAYISKQSVALPDSNTTTQFNYSDPTAVGSNELATDPTRSRASLSLTARILVLSVSGDLADRYIEIMNCIFACQRMGVPIDVLKLAGDPVFLQQAADTTGGIYMSLDAESRAGFLQSLMFAFLPDQTARQYLTVPGEGEGVDFRAACFCHKRVVDVGFVCSICLSIFCAPMPDGTCLLCGSQLTLANYGQKPIVVAKKKKKKKRVLENGGETPGSGAGTPIPV